MSGAKRGRPPKAAGEHQVTPARQLGRVDETTWRELKAAAERSGKTFTQWALEILERAAKRQK